MFGEVGHLGYLVQNPAGVLERKLVLALAPRLPLNAMVELVMDPEVTADLAVHNLVQVSKIQHLFKSKGSY